MEYAAAMFYCKHELASIVTHSCNLMGKAKNLMMTNLPVFLGHISANEGALPVKFRLHALPLWRIKKVFRDANAKTTYYSQKGFAVYTWLVFLDWITCIKLPLTVTAFQ